MKRYQLTIHTDAQEDLERLHDFLFDADPNLAEKAIAIIEDSYGFLQRMPHSCRPAKGPHMTSHHREMIVNFGKSGYLILFEITSEDTVTVLAVRHQRESDYH